VTLSPGETLGLVGESGSGKTTLGRMVIGVAPPDDGDTRLEFDGAPLPHRWSKRDRGAHGGLQMIFQNPDTALNRRHRVHRIIGRAVAKLTGASGARRRAEVERLAASVKLDARYLDIRPARLSGGLKQRVAIARAFAGDPRVIICDEPTSALDVSVQATILNVLADLQRDKGVSYLFISHDLGVVGYLADRIMVLYLGRVMEVGPAETVLRGPHHPYTEALVSAVPTMDGPPAQRIRLEGDVPSASAPPSGCVFHTRCHRSLGARCATEQPDLVEVAPGHQMRCHIPIDELRRLQGEGWSPHAAAHAVVSAAAPATAKLSEAPPRANNHAESQPPTGDPARNAK
jgi:peptide/nickel transport system ATP-binding protein